MLILVLYSSSSDEWFLVGCMRSSDRILPDFLKKNIAFSKSGRGIRFFYNTQEGMVIANISGAINRIDETKYVVKSQNGNGDYDVCSTELGWVCSCPDHKFRGVKCRP